ncbi:serine hydrolase domain-containing protein [Paenactinomyces guangxiensis]|uniref:Beta-lactamase family protein n=1 Tax=Paenactinomyces guangxiensis TaxID=1490290 RepID=A0A7W1WSX9_9BACL|nr:serine hydrolase domain-containing protein [Paenactinomyces guangxiensis]MBA4495457.1 beta-lactamase family protein [Paenactinomyces guangxiensis]MBH8592420.1 beta-lactamase family protein [Paenactinomyces guangxiensis]
MRLPVRWFSLALGIFLLLSGMISILVLSKGKSGSPSLRHEDPKGLKMEGNQLKYIDKIMEDAIRDGVFSGGTVLVSRKEAIVYEKAFGFAVRYKDHQKTPADKLIRASTRTIYDIASISKIFTATAVMQLAEKKKISLDEPVSRHLPAFAANGKEKITIRQLLTHTGGLPATLPLYEVQGGRGDRIKAALSCKLVAKPGSKMIYSDISYIALGQLVEKVSGMPLQRYMKTYIFQPLDMSTGYQPPPFLKKRIAATEYQPGLQRGLVWGEVHDENAWALDGVAGHAGLFSTAEDLAKFGLAIINQGHLNGNRILKPSTVEEMTRLQTGSLPGAFRGLGWELNQEWYMGSFSGDGAYGHTGFTGTSIMIDPKRDVMIILLTNRVHPGRTGPNVSEIRKQIAETVYSSFREK